MLINVINISIKELSLKFHNKLVANLDRLTELLNRKSMN